jgi:hypothetical protein
MHTVLDDNCRSLKVLVTHVTLLLPANHFSLQETRYYYVRQGSLITDLEIAQRAVTATNKSSKQHPTAATAAAALAETQNEAC